ncbi:hypothetical protein [Beijerinckia sp. L45]|uniref:hypothetical protein n=1 Tax=Beijerinckia sp. L45 TaxID=1641855 RepID=UPI00131DAF0E|nr:hypothetical protein [Beijerinckia sp. L45]
MVDTRIASADATLGGGHLDRSYVDWASVIGGAVVATAIFTTLSVFGSAVGLSLTSATAGGGISAVTAAIAVGLWTAWIAVSSFVAGGYIAGRLRHRIAGATPHEVEMRDGLHGLISWALAGLLSGLILASAAGSLAGHGDSAATTVQNYEVSKLFRGEKTADDTAHADAKAVLASAVASKEIVPDDRTYLAQLVTSRTGVPAATATTRVDEAVASIKTALDKARRGAVVAAFLAAVALALGAAAAWWAGTEGGKHRDEGTLFSPFTKWG